MILYNPKYNLIIFSGYGDWQGNWSNNSSSYSKYKSTLEPYLQLISESFSIKIILIDKDSDSLYYQYKSSGIFFLTLSDFINNFTDIIIYYPNISYQKCLNFNSQWPSVSGGSSLFNSFQLNSKYLLSVNSDSINITIQCIYILS